MKEFFENFLKILQENQVLLTTLGIGGAGTIIMWLKGVPQTFFNLLKREFTTEMTITSQNISFFNVIKLLEKTYADKKWRKLKVMNGRWGAEETVLGIGYGHHTLIYKKNLLFITLVKESANQTNYDKDSLTFLKLGRDYGLFKQIISDADEIAEDKSSNKIYKMEDGWRYVKDQKKRALSSVFLEKTKKKYLLETIDKFISSEEWYLSHGIPYQLGILLYGSPGTGKTSLIKAIAAYLNYSIYYLPSSRLYKIEKAVSLLPDNSILVIEDIDTNDITNRRDNGWDQPDVPEGASGTAPTTSNNKSSDDRDFETFLKMGLSEILNSLDGIFATHGRILIATTNYLESLDSALIRPGRIDIKIEVGYVNNEVLKEFCNSFFPENKINFDEIKIKKNKLTVALLQNMILEGKTLQNILDFVETQ